MEREWKRQQSCEDVNEIPDHNRRAWDERVVRRARHTAVATEKALQNPMKVADPDGWLGEVRGRRVLCLASGGGMQSALFAAAGAIVTVVDLSPEMLRLDTEIAARFRLEVRTVETSMEDLSMLKPGEFDLVIQPVSTCYVPDIRRVYDQVARVLEPQGVYVSQHKQPACLQTGTALLQDGYLVSEPYYRTGRLPPSPPGCMHRESDAIEFLHRWEQLLGELCRAGFLIQDISEPKSGDEAAAPGTFEHRSLFVPPYVKVKAVRSGQASTPATAPKLWLPG